MKYSLLACLAAALLFVQGCESNPQTTASVIQAGTATAISLGFVAIPNASEANDIATKTIKVLDENVLPILNGDEAGLVAGLKSILELKAFDDPKLAKAKLVLEAAMPLMVAYLPPDILDQQLDKVPDDVKGYLTAFFQGAHDGLQNYLGGKDMKRGFSNYADLRAKLSAK